MFTSDISLTITATRRPSRLFKTLFKSVVLPAPRNPDRTVTGRRVSDMTELLNEIGQSRNLYCY